MNLFQCYRRVEYQRIMHKIVLKVRQSNLKKLNLNAEEFLIVYKQEANDITDIDRSADIINEL